MVAYSFKKVFASWVEAKVKRQTIRGPRRRHARPGEHLQLYHGMRTKHCRKLIDPDPLCASVEPVAIITKDGYVPHLAIEMGAVTMDDPDEVDDFARADGFHPPWWDVETLIRRQLVPSDPSPRHLMAAWWIGTHGPGRFDGFLIKWRFDEGGDG